MNIAIILAGGKGTRMNLDTPKQYVLINNKPLIVHTIEAFNSVNEIDAIYLTCLKETKEYMLRLVNEYNLNKVKRIVDGGNTRQESVFNALKAIKDDKVDENSVVLIHDGARLNVSQRIILDNIKAASEFDACVTAVKATDSLFICNPNFGKLEYLNRDEVYQAQTPQSFKFSLIYNAHLDAFNSGITSATDDACLVKNKAIKVVLGDDKNIKVTTKSDLLKF